MPYAIYCYTGTASLTGKGAILIHVTDVNDHMPSFPEVEQEVNVSESVVSGFPVTVLLPQDGDHGDNGKLTCHIADGNQVSVATLVCVHVVMF